MIEKEKERKNENEKDRQYINIIIKTVLTWQTS